MKTTHNINKWSFIITLLLYLTVYLGLLAQIPLGFIQFILALSILSRWKELNPLSKKLISIYWFLFISYWLAFYLLNQSFENTYGLIFYAVIPMGIASYFVYTTYQIKKEIHELKPDYI
ncbi:hypothetical protein [uncultured Aquimarina sp.]|uniref:hypothetical protein n=1 Tax=uncultured Aquimarina sp. TaxID=575652 RepID=UPI002620F0BF|nr:hypothetical protein [uncultured Aquimarina sp.]